MDWIVDVQNNGGNGMCPKSFVCNSFGTHPPNSPCGIEFGGPKCTKRACGIYFG